jgi:3-oxoacyl-[acyl-carrier protein] reductase
VSELAGLADLAGKSDLAGKTALVTGTAHGIGAAIAATLAGLGAKVYGVDKDAVDVTDSAVVASLIERTGPVDVLVNNAGGVAGQVHHPVEDVTDEDWRTVVDANLTSTFVCTRAVVAGMKAAGAGRIVNISSGAGRSVSLTGIQAYTSAKAGQIGFTRQMAHELGPFGITVNCIAPGFVLSNPTSEQQWESYGADGQRALVERIALRRLGTAQDIANGVKFFVSADASWITGQVISIDGGQSIF